MLKKSLKTIWQYLKPFKKKVWFLLFLSIAAAAASVAIPAIYGRLVDEALAGQSLKLIGLGLLLWFLLSSLNDWLHRIVDRHSDLLAVKVAKNIILDLSDHFLHLPFSYLKNKKIGKIINKMDRAASHFEGIMERIIFRFLPDVIAVIFILFVLFFIHWFLFLLASVILFAYVFATLLKIKKAIRIEEETHKRYGNVFGDHYEYLSNFQTVKAFTAEEKTIRRLGKKFQSIVDIRWQGALVWIGLRVWGNLIFSAGFVSLFFISILMLRNGQITPGNIVSFVGYISFIFIAFRQLGFDYLIFNRAITEINQANKLYKIKTELGHRYQKTIPIEKINGEVVFDNVSFKYQGKNQKMVLNNMSFKVKSGEVVALVGGSGTGKSTLVDLISGYYLPTSGQVLIDGLSTKRIDGKSLRQHIAVVPQEVSLFHETISFNIGYGKDRTTQTEIKKAAQAANAHKFILSFPKSYKSKVGERGVKLSVGQKQRIAIARALLRDPKILILDEATSSLDSITEKIVQEALERLVRGRTTFIIAHRLSTITHADRIFVMDKGKIAEVGKHDELLTKNGIYKKLYNAQRF